MTDDRRDGADRLMALAVRLGPRRPERGRAMRGDLAALESPRSAGHGVTLWRLDGHGAGQ